jgi:hypothetical protein
MYNNRDLLSNPRLKLLECMARRLPLVLIPH